MKWIVAIAVLLALCASPAQAYKQEDLDKLKSTKVCEECDLTNADLSGIDLSGADLSGADLERSDLSGATLTGADLSGARLHFTILRNTNLANATLREIKPAMADLTGANLFGANMAGAKMAGSNLSGADLTRAHMRGVNLEGVDLTNAVLHEATGLSTLHWDNLPKGIYAVREDLKRAGDRSGERELTYALMRHSRMEAPGIEGTMNYVLFEATSDYGMSPGRPLLIMVALIFVFPIFYAAGLRQRGDDGIWRVWSGDRVRRDLGSDEPERIRHAAWWPTIRDAFYFSVLSAFHIGWREINVGNWIARLQPREYTLRATGWVRTVSGIQSLISVYLVALSVLTYFGRPFG